MIGDGAPILFLLHTYLPQKPNWNIVMNVQNCQTDRYPIGSEGAGAPPLWPPRQWRILPDWFSTTWMAQIFELFQFWMTYTPKPLFITYYLHLSLKTKFYEMLLVIILTEILMRKDDFLSFVMCDTSEKKNRKSIFRDTISM